LPDEYPIVFRLRRQPRVRIYALRQLIRPFRAEVSLKRADVGWGGHGELSPSYSRVTSARQLASNA
jgi:hypothetical protein